MKIAKAKKKKTVQKKERITKKNQDKIMDTEGLSDLHKDLIEKFAGNDDLIKDQIMGLVTEALPKLRLSYAVFENNDTGVLEGWDYSGVRDATKDAYALLNAAFEIYTRTNFGSP